MDFEKENQEKIKNWCLNNLVSRQEAIIITGQSYAAFSQSINLKKVVPFLEYGSSTGKTRLYLKKDIEIYAQHLRARKKL